MVLNSDLPRAVPERKHAETSTSGAGTSRRYVHADPDTSDFEHPSEPSPKKQRVGATAKNLAQKARRHARQETHYKKVQYPPASDYPTLALRSTPRSLYDAIYEMNTVQKKAVEDMRFGGLLDLDIRTLPTKMTYWLLESFEPKRCAIKLVDNAWLSVTAEDVIRVFGFPDGRCTIRRLERDETTDLYEQWRGLYGDAEKIWIPEVAKKMQSYTDGGSWFSRNFLILVSSTLMESYRNGEVFPFIMRCLEDVNSVQQLVEHHYVLYISPVQPAKRGSLQLMMAAPLVLENPLT